MTMPPTVLLAYELGRGFGHVAPLRTLVVPLQQAGFRVILASHDLFEAAAMLRDFPCPVIAAPSLPHGRNRFVQSKHCTSYADLLAVNGYAHVDNLGPLLRAWRDLIEVTHADLVISEHAPTANLAAKWACSRSIPVIRIGVGFTVPPCDRHEFPAYLLDRPPLIDSAQVLQTITTALSDLGRLIPVTLPEAMRCDADYVTNFPSIDPYSSMRSAPAVGPLTDLPARLPPAPADAGFFAYLNGENVAAMHVIRALGQTGVHGAGYFRNLAPTFRLQLETVGIHVHDRPVPLDLALAQASVVVHHASAGTAQTVLAAGRPQMLFPEHFEHIFTATLLHRMGVAHYQIPPINPMNAVEAIQYLRTDPTIRDCVIAQADAIHATGPWTPIPKIVEHAVRLIKESRRIDE